MSKGNLQIICEFSLINFCSSQQYLLGKCVNDANVTLFYRYFFQWVSPHHLWSHGLKIQFNLPFFIGNSQKLINLKFWRDWYCLWNRELEVSKKKKYSIPCLMLLNLLKKAFFTHLKAGEWTSFVASSQFSIHFFFVLCPKKKWNDISH